MSDAERFQDLREQEADLLEQIRDAQAAGDEAVYEREQLGQVRQDLNMLTRDYENKIEELRVGTEE